MKTIVTLIMLVFLSKLTFTQELLKFKIPIETDRINTPVSVPLNELDYNTDDGNLILYEISSGVEKMIPSQLEPGHAARLWFMMEGISEKGSEREFVLKLEKNTNSILETVTLERNHKDLKLLKNRNPVLNYRHAVTFPPDSVNPMYRRSGYIHPLWSPGGEVLTRIQPPDHYHHYGIWGPWTKTHIGEREVDFWNLAKGEGTVKFAGFLAEVAGDVFSGFQALQQHIDYGAQGEDQIAMNEILNVRMWNAREDIRIVDYTTSLNSPLESGILLNAYRYGGGIGFRATEKWHKDNCTVLTSEGKTRAEADGTNARWCIVEGESDTEAGRSGILFLSHPSNRMHPEPMRVWPLDANGGRGDMFFEFCPIRHEDWKIEPKKDYTLKYRMVIFDGEMDAEKAEMYWQSFAANPIITGLK